MTTILDSLVIELGLDPKDFNKGQKEVLAGFKRTREEASSSTKDIEASGKRAASYINGLKNEVVGLFLAFAGAKTLKDFAGGILDNAAAAGRLSANIGVSTERISAWQGAVKEMNGTADEANAALSAMSTAISNFNLTRSTGNDAVFRALGVTQNDLAAGPEAMMLRIAQAGEHMNRRNYVNLLQRLGFGPGMIAVLEQGRSGLEKVLTQQERMYAVTQRDAEAAMKFQKALADIGNTARGVALPYVSALAEEFDQFAANRENIVLLGDAAAGAVAAIGVAAAAAYWPVVALAGAITGLLRVYQLMHNASPEERKRLEDHSRELRDKTLSQLGHGNFSGAWNTVKGGLSEGADLMFNGNRSGGAGAAGGGGVIGYFMSQGFTREQAQGILAGIYAESGGNPNATNPTSGAYGLGQWLGGRKQKLFARYGNHPSAKQQLEFLAWELHGGDRGAGAVQGASSADAALQAYIVNFMRPRAGAETLGDLRRGRQKLAELGAGGSTINLNGPITVTTNARDANSLARDLPGAVRRRASATPANSGLS